MSLQGGLSRFAPKAKDYLARLRRLEQAVVCVVTHGARYNVGFERFERTEGEAGVEREERGLLHAGMDVPLALIVTGIASQRGITSCNKAQDVAEYVEEWLGSSQKKREKGK